MLRFQGRFSLAAIVLCVGLVHADSKTPAKKNADDKVITIMTSGGKPHRCQVLRTYKHSSGGTALEVKDLETGEIMTVVENGAKPTTTTKVETKSKVESPVKTAQPLAQIAAQSSSMPATDPIMQPKQYAGGKKVQQQLADDGKAENAAKTGGDVKATSNRWSGKPAEKKVAIAIAQAPPMEAIRHPDPVIRMIGCLKDDMLPSMREIAADSLAQSEARNRPEVITALSEGAMHDPAGSVRACCFRGLTIMSTGSPEAMAALQKVKIAGDNAIRAAGGVVPTGY